MVHSAYYVASEPTTTAITLINSFVISRVDYCNSLLCGLPSYQLARIQSVLSAAARIIYRGKRSDHVTPLLCDRLHWLQSQNSYVSNCALWYSRLSTICHRNTSLTTASRCPTRHVKLVSGRHLAICWTSRKHGLNSENVLSPLLDQRHGMHCPSA